MKGFGPFLLKRVVYSFFLVLCTIIITFVLLHAAPGDPVTYLAGLGSAPVSAEYIESVRKSYGLDKPITEQFFIYMINIFRGNFGVSMYYRLPVLTIIMDRLPATLLLVGVALVFALLLAILIGTIAAVRKHTVSDSAIRIFSLSGYSIPTFWLAELLVVIFSIWLGWFPATGMHSTQAAQSSVSFVSIQYTLDLLWHLALPATCISLWYLALFTRLTRAGMLQILGKNFITLARAKGLGERTVLMKHALKNALAPLLPVVGWNIGLMLAGATLAETAFSWPGEGSLLYQSLVSRDYPTLLGLVVLISISVVVTNLVADLVYATVDPRVTYE